MSEPPPQGSDFEAKLHREVERVLVDPAFDRSPVQSRLLRYLCEQTIARNRNLSQLAVAVDGLGRPETVDQLTESYPRVQISRLRRNLALYYARHAPGEGLAVYIRHGDYHLRLAPPEKAYPEPRPRAAPSPANDTAAASPRPAPPVVHAEPPLWRKRRWHPLPLAAAAIVGLALAMASVWLSDRLSSAPASTEPRLAVRIEHGSASDALLVLAAQQAEDVAANSYVVGDLAPERGGASADYVLRLDRTQSIEARPMLDVSLYDPAQRRLFHDAIPIGPDRTAMLARLNGALVSIVGPTGVIARRELDTIGEIPASGYECVLRSEADRLQGNFSRAKVESCLARFPDSEYRPYWLARLAFISYRDDALAGRTIEASGEPWQNLQQAFAADPANPFVNYVTAKVGFARGDCEAARPYVERTLTSGNYHGTLMAATLSEAALCGDRVLPQRDAQVRVAALVDGLPEPNPLMHIYLIFASAAVERPDLARRLLETPTSEPSQGSLADTSDALDDALASREAFAANRARLQKVVETFYWGPKTRAELMMRLEAVAAYQG